MLVLFWKFINIIPFDACKIIIIIAHIRGKGEKKYKKEAVSRPISILKTHKEEICALA